MYFLPRASLCVIASPRDQIALTEISTHVMLSVRASCPPLPVRCHDCCRPRATVTSQGDEAEFMDKQNPNVPQVFGNSRKIPTQITSIAHYVRRSGGKPRMLLLPLGELSLYKAFFSDRVYEVSCGVVRACRLGYSSFFVV